ncbi:hypothetical protein F1C58_03950 [Glaciihabitans sp. INWT7]|uniref:HTH domain-containing protein n=1 Tax=Glaciihabitans sp. INWT7 TaxID=2596912 RepID=UPI001627F18C|nr:HTH domain-containing protein [Glaciihabitans sp. INWT7]QNE46145.1 hypothetical protein F1C58_03950 [Glaciihabitans sp. INWT7]
MTVEAQNPAEELRRIISEGHISEDALQAMTGIRPEKLRTYVDDAKPGMMALSASPQALSNDESGRLSILVAHLTEGMQIGDDERLMAIFESLTIECHLTLQNIAQLTGLDIEDLKGALHDPRTVPIKKKYELAIRGSYLINAVNRARGQ